MNSAFHDHETGRAARILTAAEALVLKRGLKGVTVAEIAEQAHVGKGTVYLYWGTKESLFIELLGRSFLTVLDELAEQIRARPELARPDHLCPYLVHSVLQQPLVRAAQTSDADILGALAEDPRSREMLDRHGAAALIRALLPRWRRQGLARTDWDLDRQACALQMLTVGFLETTARHRTPRDLDQAERDAAMTEAVAALLTTPADPPCPPDETALDAIALLEQARNALRASIDDHD